ncbi:MULTISPECIES: hypothetical protein [unclassified Archaeoglobus]|jgi:hypothetical protein|uniref:hypothetical protein n=1 Tax=unclassified Archaeoglobus TaxID=2643606 RepID=UPI0025C42D77|nr:MULTISPECIES: hypothetical protein [unclassified Archaeoglobus]
MPKRRLQTTLSDEAFKIIEKFKPNYGGINEIIEEALKLLNREDSSLSEDDLLLIKLIRELDFTGCGRSQYMHLICGDLKSAVEESMMETAVEWFLKKPFPEIELEEFLETVKRGWKILNRVDYVEITKGDGWIQFFCEHTMRRREVSEFLAMHILNIYEKYYKKGWKVVKSVSTNGFTLKFYRQ